MVVGAEILVFVAVLVAQTAIASNRIVCIIAPRQVIQVTAITVITTSPLTTGILAIPVQAPQATIQVATRRQEITTTAEAAPGETEHKMNNFSKLFLFLLFCACIGFFMHRNTGVRSLIRSSDLIALVEIRQICPIQINLNCSNGTPKYNFRADAVTLLTIAGQPCKFLSFYSKGFG